MALDNSMSDKHVMDFYQVLGVSRTASAAEIEAACLRLGGSLRSAIEASGKDAAGEQFRLIEKAFETLTNPESRAAYDRRLAAAVATTLSSPGSEVPPPPHKREGILVMAGAVSIGAIVIAAAVVMAGPTSLGVMAIIGLTTFRLLPYESESGYTYYTAHLIELDATIALLFCFLVGLYGLLVFLTVLPKPSTLWHRIARLWGS